MRFVYVKGVLVACVTLKVWNVLYDGLLPNNDVTAGNVHRHRMLRGSMSIYIQQTTT